ncbi:hypothetical protein [Sphingomonas aracearum]|uniref:hypothetical protein n=1 Tax=Sphingomonas aracearum TaxID=2283317 RepID=UPI001EF0A355|nr:hypothetical protein [Sphingomonas aracearum]
MSGTLTLKRPAVAAAPAAPACTPIIFEAIVRKMCLSATYNRVEMTLAPHILYTKHDELFMDAEPIAREGKPPREPKIATFKLAGLSAVRLTPRAFQRSPLFEADAERYSGVTLMAIEG